MKDINSNELNTKKFIIKKVISNENYQDKNQVKFLTKKNIRFKLKRNKIKKIFEKTKSNKGRWTKEEHDKFLDGIVQYGCNWIKVDRLIKTRIITQVRSHAQKFFIKLKICKDEDLGIDFTSDSICNIKDMINHIKSVNNNYNIKNILKYLDNKYDQNEHKKINLFENNESGQNKNLGDISKDINNTNLNQNLFSQNQSNKINEINNNNFENYVLNIDQHFEKSIINEIFE